ncbi:hypothetical protein ACHHYP_05181 [Achlya hypogyna]|uniref:Secreted protein n=1 Tax=Achlya hypogyna TaxID=1202772 RepID=A0A0A7CMA0_ACHHY|nr:secreted protein [Achlya hypogyna]OQR90872.1 hypothetical protein ACHHYP_05181 [Achlya hypogyna]
MCPLRYILLAVSLLVALIGLSQAALEDDAVSSHKKTDAEDEDEGRKKSSTFKTIVDMLSGRYLLDAYYGRAVTAN